MGYERHGFTGEQFILEKGEYPRWDTWTNNQSSYTLLSLRPLKVVSPVLLLGFPLSIQRPGEGELSPSLFPLPRMVPITSCNCTITRASTGGR